MEEEHVETSRACGACRDCTLLLLHHRVAFFISDTRTFLFFAHATSTRGTQPADFFHFFPKQNLTPMTNPYFPFVPRPVLHCTASSATVQRLPTPRCSSFTITLKRGNTRSVMTLFLLFFISSFSPLLSHPNITRTFLEMDTVAI